MYHFVYADEDGNGYIDEAHYALGLLGNQFVEPAGGGIDPFAGGRESDDDPGQTGGGDDSGRAFRSL